MKYKLLRLSLLSMLIMLCGGAFALMAQAEDVTYEKITSTDNLTDGEYLIVYENGNVAFNGALTTLDAVDNVTAVTIESGAITGSEAINAATFTIVNTDNGYTIQSASGKFIGITSYSNGLKQADAAANGYYHSISFDEGNAVIKVTTSSGDMTLRFNSASNQNRFRYYKSGQQAIALYKKVAGGQTDNRVATSITLVNPTTKAAVGDVVALPSAELKAADESNITDAVITWESSDETVAAFVDNTETGMKELKALKAGTATITAKYAGNTTYKESSASFTLTVKEYTQYTTIAEMLENITSTKTDIKYTFSGLTVTYVNGKYTYIYKSGDGAMLLYGDNLGLEEGCVYNGSLVGQLYTYNGLPEIAVSANDINVEKQDGMIAIAITLINPDELPNYINKQCAIQHAEYVSTASGNMTFTVGDKAFIVRNSFGIDLPELTEGKKYFIEGFGAVYTKNNTTTYQLYPTNVTEEQEAAVEFQDFEITNEQLSGALDTSTLPACVTFNGTQRNDSHGYGNVTMSVVVNGPVKFTIGGCQYANPANCKVTNVAGELLAEPYVKTATCYHQDGAAVTYEYTGEATTLTFSDIAYLPYFKAEAFEPEPEPVVFQDFEITNEQLSGALDTSTLPACVTFNGTQRNDSHGYGNVTMSVVVNGPVKFTIGGCQYANPANCKVTNAAGELLAEPYVKTATCYHQDGAAVTYEYTGEATTLTFSDIAYLPYFKAEAFEPEPEPVVFQDFEITNEQMSGEFDASTLPACATFQGTQRGDSHGYGNVTLTVAVNGPVKFTIGGCQYANPATCKVTNAEGELLAEPNLKTATCYHQDGAAAIYEYKGEATTLTFSDIAYLPYFKAEAFEPEPEPVDKDITGTWSYGNATVMSETIALSGSNEAGEVNSIEGTLKMTVEANGATFRNNGDNIQVRSGAVFKVPVRAAGDLITVVGYPGYSYYTIGDSEELNNENTYKAKGSDAERGYVAITSTNDNNYFKSISVVQYAPKEKITLDNEPATATFPFNEGTEGQKATFSNADYFLSSKVKVGSNWSILDKTTYAGTEETRLTPVDQHDTDLTDADAVSFIITPKPGFVFTPTKVSFKANRFGTDNGLIDAYWQNANGTTVELEKGIKPERNNSNLNTEKAYDITGATAGEGACGLKLFLYHLQAGKQIGLADIVIEGILNGTEKDVPVLASFKINGKEYAAEDVFGEQYEATLELSKAEAMVSENNPLTDVTAKSGEVGTITYEEKESACTVTIPMTAGETLMDYVLNVVFKPDFTLSYLDVEGNVLKTQAVEKDAAIGAFAYDINEVAATKDGYKARGWFKTGVLGEKFTTADVITADTKLYAIQTEIEVSSTHKKYNFDLTDKLFYAEDHEAFNPAGEGYYWHDGQHGWAFKNGNTVDLLVGPKATITVTLCQYGSGTGIVVKKGDQTLATLEGKAEGDGGTAVYSYEGEPGTLTLEMQCGGEMYIHAVKIVNTTEVNFDSDGNWYFVKAGDAGSLIDVIDVVNGVNASRDAQRSFIFLPNGTYDLDATVKTAITGHNISLIGESMDKTIIVTKPDKSIEGLGKADLFDVSGTNLYMQDLTLKNALDYYNAGSAGRAAVLQDAGNRTIGKNVRMLSYQDTYYSSNSSQQAYWEDCDIHGTVDFICGGGDIRFQNTTISLEPRAKDGKGGRTIVAPTTNTNFGYVFDGCTIVDLSEGKGDWNFGRTWQNEPITVYLNTTLDDVAKNTLISKRWTEKGMNNKDPKVFGEFATKDASGTDITPASNTITSFGGTFETILTAEQAAEYSYEKMFTNWHPASLTEQIDAAMLNPVYENGNVSFAELDNGMQGCAIFKNGEFVAISGSGYAIAIDPATDELTVRVVNMMGGFGPAAQVAMTGTSIQAINAAMERGEQVIYNLSGQRVNRATKGLYIINGKKIAVK